MRRVMAAMVLAAMVLAATVLAVAVLTACDGAQKPASTAQTCSDVWKTFNRYTTGDAPELKAFNQAVNDQYRGRGEPGAFASAQAAYFAAFKRALRDVADRASDPALRDAINSMADGIDRLNASAGGDGLTELMRPVTAICPIPEPS